jgi:hypothetical protein
VPENRQRLRGWVQAPGLPRHSEAPGGRGRLIPIEELLIPCSLVNEVSLSANKNEHTEQTDRQSPES